MKVVGIIAEYNPFHNGHAYQIQEIREKLNADYVIVAMSGDFVQRGTLAITDKYTRTNMALSNGADVVFELPTLWATASAEYFAKAGVNLLEKTSVVDTLCFGAESNDLESLSSIAKTLKEENSIFTSILASELEKGNNYPTARSLALKQCLSLDNLDSLLNCPNNILAIEYLKALQDTSILPYLIRRDGDDYHDKSAFSTRTSATALRRMVSQNEYSSLADYMPEAAFLIFEEVLTKKQYLTDNDISSAMGYALLSNQKTFEDYADCNRELADKITKNLCEFKDFHSFCETLKTKEITYTRISRALLHIVLNHTKVAYEKYKEIGYVPYLRLLGFKKESSDVLSHIKANASIPIISKMADAQNHLSEDALTLLEYDIFASNLYNQILYSKNVQIPNDYKHQIVIR